MIHYTPCVAQFQFVEWLALWILETLFFRFEWDEGNQRKSYLKHGVTCDEVEEFFILGSAIPIGVQVSPPVDEERLAIVGPTAESRLLMVVFTLRRGVVSAISARAASRKERRLYEKVRKVF